jgi:threonine synthase
MRLISTRDAATAATFRQAVLAGIAPGGGLWLPDLLSPFGRISWRSTGGAAARS